MPIIWSHETLPSVSYNTDGYSTIFLIEFLVIQTEQLLVNKYNLRYPIMRDSKQNCGCIEAITFSLIHT